jgi:hypothetical protein
MLRHIFKSSCGPSSPLLVRSWADQGCSDLDRHQPEIRTRNVVNTTRKCAHRSIAHVLLTVAGMTGIAGLFLPFTWGKSPVDAASYKELWRLALPFFLAVFASAASIRWVVSGSFSGLERAIAYVVSTLMVGVTLSIWFSLGPTSQEWLAIIIPGSILASGVYFLIRNSRTGPSRQFNPVMAIQVAYLAHAVLCVIGYLGRWELGAYCVLVAALAFLLQIILVSAQPGRLWDEDTGTR